MDVERVTRHRGSASTPRLLLAALALAAGAACGAPSSAEVTGETIGSAEAAADGVTPVEVPAAAEGSATIDPPVPPGAPVGSPLPPGSTAEQILDAVIETHGPTADVSAQVNRFIAFPPVSTPSGAELIELRADVRDTLERSGVAIVSEVTLEVDGAVADVIEFYQADFERRSWVLTADSRLAIGDRRVERLSYQIPDTAFPRADVQLSVVAAPDSGGIGQRSRVHLRYWEVRPAVERSARQRFEDWAGDLPLPEGGQVTGAGIHTTLVGRNSLHFSLAVRYPGIEPGELADRLRAALPSAGYSIEPKPPLGGQLDDWVYLRHDLFAEARVSTHPVTSDGGDIGTVVNVDARVEFSPAG